MKGMLDMARKAKGIQKKLRKTRITAEAEGGKIKVVMNGEMTVVDLEIDESILTDKDATQNGLKQAINEAHKKAQQIAAQESKDLLGGMGM